MLTSFAETNLGDRGIVEDTSIYKKAKGCNFFEIFGEFWRINFWKNCIIRGIEKIVFILKFVNYNFETSFS